MIIIAGYSIAKTPEDRDAAVAAFAPMVDRARQFDGCLDLAIGADSLDPKRLNLFECWRDQKSLNAWRKVAKGPRVKRMEGHVKLYRSEAAERPF